MSSLMPEPDRESTRFALADSTLTSIPARAAAFSTRRTAAELAAIAEAIFPDFKTFPTIETLEQRFPARGLGENAFVTRVGPSPTGMMHLGGLYAALINRNLAQHSGGVFMLRVEDTDQKRTIPGATETIIDSLKTYGLSPHEGPNLEGSVAPDSGGYGPYIQSARLDIYRAVAFDLLKRGVLYPCFMTEDEIHRNREMQTRLKVPVGVYAEWSRSRDLPVSEVLDRLSRREPLAIRFRATAEHGATAVFDDAIRGKLTHSDNGVDAVMFKSDGMPLYHFAHLVDDHFMRTTHVIRGEEWLSSVPLHLQLFNAAGWEPPVYGHLAPICKLDRGAKRKLSKRKDPEADVRFYLERGFPTEAVVDYLANLANSGFEDWRRSNPNIPADVFRLSLDKMTTTGPLADMDKLENISRSVLASLPTQALVDKAVQWARAFEPALGAAMDENPELTLKAVMIDRTEGNSGKRFTTLADVRQVVSPFFAQFLPPAAELPLPSNLSREDIRRIGSEALDRVCGIKDGAEFFPAIQKLAADIGFAPSTKEFKKNPGSFTGHVGDVAMVLRVAVFGGPKSPDLGQVIAALGEEETRRRVSRLLEIIA